MSFKKKSMVAGLISAAIILPTSTGVSFANGNNEGNLQIKSVDHRVVTGNSVNFRKGPGTNYNSIGKLNKGDRVEYLETVGSWIKVKHNSNEGFVHSNYISTSSNTGESNEDTSVKSEKQVTGNRVNFRKGPGTSYSIITSLNKGTKVGYISENNGWAKISHNGNIGYMSTNYLATIDSNSGGNNSESNEDSTVKSEKQVTGNRVNFRKGPGTNYSVITSLNKGTKVGYISESNGWAKISYNGNIGYMSTNYLATTDSNSGGNNSESNEDSTIKSEKQVTGNTVNFRKGPGTNYSVITSLNKGTKVGYISESNGWAKVNYNGTIGYMSANYIGYVDSNSGAGESGTSQGADAVISLAKQQLGKPYVWGAEGPGSFDCSGFTQYVFKNAAGKILPRVSKEQSKFGQSVNKSNLQKGDLIFFDTDKDGVVNHVGIYMGNNEFIHASSGGKKVMISQLNSYYNSAYTNARRVL
ncbi:SH3 domain-containing protein [Paraclostridium sordellii]|uniref:SH3 domain-containing protein n=1 Tax=Paraclostridium sordellii TaxID=1505 RepID=UPI00189ADBE4|nr:SH3 domain-containing protein [Paeniclostridium sordellii]